MNSLRSCACVVLAAALPGWSTLHAQNRPLLFEIEAGMGYTQVDREKWAGTGALSDWNQTMYAGNARLFFASFAGLRVGVEAGYQYFWWYETRTPSGSQFIYSGYDVSATHVSGTLRYEGGSRVTLDVGAGMHMFDGFSDFGSHVAVGYRIPVTERLSVPLRLRVDPILDSDALLLPVGAYLGLSYKP